MHYLKAYGCFGHFNGFNIKVQIFIWEQGEDLVLKSLESRSESTLHPLPHLLSRSSWSSGANSMSITKLRVRMLTFASKTFRRVSSFGYFEETIREVSNSREYQLMILVKRFILGIIFRYNSYRFPIQFHPGLDLIAYRSLNSTTTWAKS